MAALLLPDGDFTVAAEFKRIYTPPAATYYTVTLPSVEGATLSKQAGDHTVEEGYSFTFAITLDENYSESIPIVTTDRGETIIPDTNGRYKINNVAEDIVVSISGIVKNLPIKYKSTKQTRRYGPPTARSSSTPLPRSRYRW